ncbi:MAG: CCA tRNA nucleotidyltransferase [Rubripirellula sp.]|nr:CCA tRNA nucleotidyltransferase [Rubripirellula sp.]
MVDHKNLENAHRFLRGPEATEALRIISELHAAGFTAYMAGGCVRDAMLGNPPKDYDVATDATPDAIRDVFGKRKTLAFGASFGVMAVLPSRGGRGSSAEPTEVATFRSDGQYSDGRRPDSVHFGDAEHDVLRRDFTINGLFYDPLADRVIDFVGGVDDLKRGLLRTIGKPVDRFAEDKLRMLRAVRFATTMAFKIDPDTQAAIIHHAADITQVSGERIGAEMRRVMVHPNLLQGLRHLQSCGLDQQVFPELNSLNWDLLRGMRKGAEGWGMREESGDGSGRWNVPRSLAAFVSSLEDPSSVPLSLIDRWRLSNLEVRMADSALRHWQAIATADQQKWSTVQPILIDRDIDTILWLADARVAAEQLDSVGVEKAREALGWPTERLDPPPLLNGDDLRQLGIPGGPELGRLLKRTREAQLNRELQTREEAEKTIEKWRKTVDP